MKRFRWILLGVLALILANLTITLWTSFETSLDPQGERWKLAWYDVSSPQEVLQWVGSAAVITLVTLLAAWFNFRCGFRRFTSFLVASIGGSAIAAYGSLLTYAATQPTFMEALVRMLRHVAGTQPFMAAHILTAMLASLLGVLLARYFLEPTGAGPQAAKPKAFVTLAATWARIVKTFRRPWWEKPENFLRVLALQCRTQYRA